MPTTESTLTNMPIEKLTEAKLAGTGTFDVLMRATKAHLEDEFNKGRIKGPEYSTVYLGSLTTVMEQSIRFLMDKDKSALEAALIEAQVRLADAQVRLVEAQILKEENDKDLIAAQAAKIRRETLFIDVQEADVLQKTANAVIEGQNLLLSQSLLNAQIALTTAQKTSTDAQSALVIQKTITEKAQTLAGGVEENSVVGKQKNLYQAQTNGYLRDAEQRAAKLMTDTWMTRRTTDEGTVADATNRLNDATVGIAVQKMLAGVGVVV